MAFVKTTEKTSKYNNLEKMSVKKILKNINSEDKTIPYAIEKSLPQIEKLINQVITKMKNGGRLFYIGAGTSGRLGVVDASECPPTFGVPFNLVIGIIAGGDKAIRRAVEFAEDSTTQGWKDLKKYKINKNDFVIGISASGTPLYVINALKECNKRKIFTGCITCNKNSPLSLVAKYPIEVVVGAEFVTGSSRMKAGTAQKLVLNMISTTTMIQLGRVLGNKMVDMKLTNNKLIDRGTKIIMDEYNFSYEKANTLLKKHKCVRTVLNFLKK
jgi:N-acetylmuramic acid 6-phosphate etherase